MHDRRVDGETRTFGNNGGLYMKAMTWWDHGTQSVWSQPWGAVLNGSLAGTSLTPLPAEVVRWGAWVADYPQTRVLVDERGERFGRQLPEDNFVIGVALNDAATAYHFRSAQAQGVINDSVGTFPVVVTVDKHDGAIDVYLRTVPMPDGDGATRTLTFEPDEGGVLRDAETGSSWDIRRGVALSGPLRGTVLRQAPYVSAFDWAWEDFYPNTRFWGEKPVLPLPEFFG